MASSDQGIMISNINDIIDILTLISPIDDILQEFLIKHRETDTNEPKDTPLSFPPPPATSDQFNIPVLPTGSQLTLFINSTWGDRYYVGLTGVEIFDERGNIPSTQDVSDENYFIRLLMTRI